MNPSSHPRQPRVGRQLQELFRAAGEVDALARARFGGRRAPVHPGKFLETRFLQPLGLTQTDLAHALGVSRRRVNELIRGHRTITPDTAIRLAALFRNEPQFWIGLQSAWDLHVALKRFADSGAAEDRSET